MVSGFPPRDIPEGLFNTDSHIVIEDLTRRPQWLEVLRAAGLENSENVRILCEGYVYALSAEPGRPPQPDDSEGHS